ncbi:MAG TPA: HAD-IA family hydrolase [Candidatus Acidoferrum sp.]|jgi:phosphoglycolate phosphatase|nr:HAD-IA family hydrolase [Candidatus Acidoferrum sp.]
MTTPEKYAVRALVFDLDGTLIDSKLDLILSVNAMLAEMGREKLSDEVISSYIGHGAPRLVSRALGGVAKEDELARGLSYFLDYYEEHKLDNTRLYPEAAETLAKLSDQNMAMAVLTNKPVKMSVGILEALGAAKYFQAIYGGNSFETKKPDPLGAKTILVQFQVKARDAMMIGDSEVDIQTARNADMIATAVNFGFGVHDRAQHPADIYLDRMSDLLGIIDASHFAR